MTVSSVNCLFAYLLLSSLYSVIMLQGGDVTAL